MTFFDRLNTEERAEFEREANSYIDAAAKLGVILEMDDLKALAQAQFNKMLEAYK